MARIFHRSTTATENHVIHGWEVANSAGRVALVPTATDLGRVARQADDGSLWACVGTSPAAWRRLDQIIFSGVGDGVADETESIRAFLSTHAGRECVFPAGRYLVSGTIVVPTGTTIVGESTPGQVNSWNAPQDFYPVNGEGTVFLRNGSDCSIFVMSNRRSSLRHITVLSPSGQNPTSGDLVLVSGQNNTLFGVTACGGWNCLRLVGNGVNSCGWTVIESCMFNMGASASIFMDGTNGSGTGALVNDIYIRATMVLNDPRGYLDPTSAIGTGLKASGYIEALCADTLSIWGGAKSLEIDSATYGRNTGPAGFKFNSCWFDTATQIASINNLVNGRFTSCWFVGSRGAATAGLTIYAATDVAFLGCEFVTNTLGQGAACMGPSEGLSFTDCNAANNGDHGWYINWTCSGTTLNGCRTALWPGTGPNQANGVYVGGGSAIERVMIVNCTLTGNTSAGLVDASEAGSTKVIANNFTT